MLWKKKSSENVPENLGHSLYLVLCESVKKNGRIRVEDLITVISSVVAELCIETAADFDPRHHKFVPGSRVFSDKVNQIFNGDVQSDDLAAIPAESIVGILRDRLLSSGYQASDFPPLEGVFKYFAANIGKPEDWGKVPLAVPQENQPFVLPLQMAYEARPAVDRVLKPIENSGEKLRAAVVALSEAMIAVRNTIDRRVAVLLALQMINGMAKTAPMTEEAMESLKKQAMRRS
jgi:hypothetical protein